MSVYIVPNDGDMAELSDTTKKAGVELISAQNVREFIMQTADKPMILSTIKSNDLIVLNRHAPTLIEELPTVVMSVPGLVYTGEWVSLASAFPAIDWSELASKLAKSGHLATTPEDLPKRDKETGEQTMEAYANFGQQRPSLASAEKTDPRASWARDDGDNDTDPDMEVE